MATRRRPRPDLVRSRALGGRLPAAEPTPEDGDRLARTIRNEVGRTFWATGGEAISGDQAFAQVMARANARVTARGA